MSDVEPKYAPVIDNKTSRYHLLDLSTLSLPPGIQRPHSGKGPFVVLQQGAMPGDARSKPLDFLRTKEGLWLPVFAALRLPVQQRDALCIFATMAEAIQQLENLTGPAIVDAERIAHALYIELPPVGPNGVVYEKDLGANTLKTFETMDRLNPDKTWNPTDDQWPEEEEAATQ